MKNQLTSDYLVKSMLIIIINEKYVLTTMSYVVYSSEIIIVMLHILD